MKKRHGWFSIAGIQTGERSLKEAVIGLNKVAAAAPGATVLDLGCAEGLVGKWLLDSFKAKLVHGLELHPPYIEMANLLHGFPVYDGRIKFFACDLDHFEVWQKMNPGVLLPRYDIVMALRILQKLTRPREVLLQIAALADNILALNLPEAIIDDRRSGHVPVDPVEALRDQFELIDQTQAKLGLRMIFKRIKEPS